jgi:hypothetical protein
MSNKPRLAAAFKKPARLDPRCWFNQLTTSQQDEVLEFVVELSPNGSLANTPLRFAARHILQTFGIERDEEAVARWLKTQIRKRQNNESFNANLDQGNSRRAKVATRKATRS